MANENPFFSTDMPLGAKRIVNQPETLRSVTKDSVNPKAFPRQFQPTPGVLPEPRRIIMSSDLRRLQENKERLRISAERKAVERLKAAAVAVEDKATRVKKPRARKAKKAKT